MATPTSNNIAQLLRAASQSGILDYNAFSATAQELIRGRRVPGQSFPLPKDHKYHCSGRLSAEQYYDMDEDNREKYIRHMLADGISGLLERPGIIDIEIMERRDTRDMEVRGSVYVFGEQQLKELIREIEDAVKESLAE